ncbi:MAG: site-specific integrase [Anaerolineales bacterium]|nr:site-specific integrase [Anaerolineales bacterium]
MFGSVLRASVDPESNKGKRDLVILDLMLFLRLRCSQVAGLELSDIVRDSGRHWLHVTGKGTKTRRLKINDTAFASLMNWLKAANLSLSGSGAVFRSVNKGGVVGAHPVTAATVGGLVSEYGAAAGLAPAHGDSRLAPHDLRRTAARNTLDNGANLVQVQSMPGHSSPDTTAGYIGAYDRDDDAAVDYVRY